MPLILTVMDNDGGKVIGGGGPGGRMPVGRLNAHPWMLMSIQLMQRLKNHRLHGMMLPFTVPCGDGTGVTTGSMPPSHNEVSIKPLHTCEKAYLQ